MGEWEILPFTYYKIPTTDEVIHEIKVKVETENLCCMKKTELTYLPKNL